MKKIVILTLLLAVFLLNGCLQEKHAKKPQFKGMELYSYVDDGNTIRYSLLIGTNRIKSVDEIVRSSLSYRELIKRIKSLAPKENISWINNRPKNIALKYPDEATTERIKSICKELDIELHLMSRYNKAIQLTKNCRFRQLIFMLCIKDKSI